MPGIPRTPNDEPRGGERELVTSGHGTRVLAAHTPRTCRSGTPRRRRVPAAFSQGPARSSKVPQAGADSELRSRSRSDGHKAPQAGTRAGLSLRPLSLRQTHTVAVTVDLFRFVKHANLVRDGLLVPIELRGQLRD